jgi:hypothetical protein
MIAHPTHVLAYAANPNQTQPRSNSGVSVVSLPGSRNLCSPYCWRIDNRKLAENATYPAIVEGLVYIRDTIVFTMNSSARENFNCSSLTK